VDAAGIEEPATDIDGSSDAVGEAGNGPSDDRYNDEREHQGRWCCGKTPMHTLATSG
jgi:hypothetical protein